MVDHNSIKLLHIHFGKDGGAERFFVHLINALDKRLIEQECIIRPDRVWKREIPAGICIKESHFRNLSFDRLVLPMKMAALSQGKTINTMLAWMPRASRLLPNSNNVLRISRLGDYPLHLNYFKNTDVLVCNTPLIAEHVKNMGWQKGVDVISNFTSTTRVTPVDRALYDTPFSAPLIMGMGRFVPRKGFRNLISAVSHIRDAYLWISGDGEERESLELHAKSCGMSNRIRFLGWQSDPRPFVAACDVFTMTSSHEPLGNVVLEAWAQNRPVISTKSEGPTWFMDHNTNGILVEIGDENQLRGAISDLLNDGEKSRRIADGGTKTLMENFSEEAVSSAYIDLFKKGRID